MSSKSEKPTRKRLRDARKRGEALVSREVTGAAGYIVLVAAMIVMAPWFWKRLQRVFELMWSDKVMAAAPDAWRDVLAAFGRETAELAIPLALLTAAACVLAAFVQVRGIFSMDPVLPQLQRINPVEGFKRLFSSQNLFELIKLLIKLILMCTTIFWVIKYSATSIMRLMYGSSVEGARAAAYLLLLLFLAIGALFVIFAIIDFIHQYYEYMKKMRMSKEEVRREFRDIDGNPHIKNARRRLARELAFTVVGDATRKASVVVVNPTHFAVALVYEAGVTELPVVVEKGVDDQALFLRTVAREAGVPVVEFPALARALFAAVPVASYIPQELFPAVADVLGWIKQARPAGDI
jgi:type III secretion protein U